jgi:hypothetical protein
LLKIDLVELDDDYYSDELFFRDPKALDEIFS